MTDEVIEEQKGTPAIFLRKVDVVIQNNDDEEPIVIKAEQEEEKTEE